MSHCFLLHAQIKISNYLNISKLWIGSRCILILAKVNVLMVIKKSCYM